MRKGIRVTVYVVFALTVLYFVVEWFLEAKIRYFVEKKVEEVSRVAVRAEIGSVSLRLIGRSLWLEEVKISSDTVALRRSGWPLKRVEGYFDRLGARGCISAREIRFFICGPGNWMREYPGWRLIY